MLVESSLLLRALIMISKGITEKASEEEATDFFALRCVGTSRTGIAGGRIVGTLMVRLTREVLEVTSLTY